MVIKSEAIDMCVRYIIVASVSTDDGLFVRRASLSLIKKMVHYIQPSLLVEACSPESSTYNLGTMLVEVIATVLDNEVINFFITKPVIFLVLSCYEVE